MVRYRRYKRRYRNSTRSIMMKFQSFMDISTSPDSMQIITISAGGPEIVRRLAPQFAAYKYYRIGNIACKLVPASTLPVDPSGLSYSSSEPGIDPRDQLTPGMMRITNGEDIFENISGLTDAQQHGIYNNMLLDPRWFKWMLQSGVKRHATPRYWQIGQLHQDKWPGATLNVPELDGDTGLLRTTAHIETVATQGVPITTASPVNDGSRARGLFQVGHRGTLGWLPTDDLAFVANVGRVPTIASPPEVEVMKIILPKAYKTRYYYRMFITETVYFREPIVNFGIADASGNAYRPLDVFHYPGTQFPILPGQAIQNIADYPLDSQTGGNYGDD